MWYQGLAILQSTISLTESITELLILDAISLLEEENDIKSLRKNDLFEGTIMTDGEHLSLGGLNGQKFSVELESDKGRDRVVFLFNYLRTEHPILPHRGPVGEA